MRLSALFLLVLFLTAPAQNSETYTGFGPAVVYVIGILETAEGHPVVGANVEFIGKNYTFDTDKRGSFGTAHILEGRLLVRITVAGGSATVRTPYVSLLNGWSVSRFSIDRNYVLRLSAYSTPGVVGKPNVYLYPEAETDVNVWLSFVGGGRMTVSEPEYIEGWDVTVTPEGKITAYEPVYFMDPDTGEHWPIPTRGEPAGEYDYLFYEGEVAGPGQLDSGWVVGRDEIEPFFREKLAAYGFAGREIEDFVEFWVPRLSDYPRFAVYPQAGADYDTLVSMAVFPAPDSILRVVFTIRGLWEGAELNPTEPAITPFERRGFTVVEWGVILKESDARFYLR